MLSSTFYVLYDSIVYVKWLTVPCQAIMLFFFLEMLSETTAAYFAVILVNKQFDNSFAFVTSGGVKGFVGTITEIRSDIVLPLYLLSISSFVSKIKYIQNIKNL